MNKITQFRLFASFCLALFAAQCYSATWFFNREPQEPSSRRHMRENIQDQERAYSHDRERTYREQRARYYSRDKEGYARSRPIGEFSHPPQKVALLLPLSGKHGTSARAIRDGFFASYYASSSPKPIIRVYDTAQGQNVQKLYEYALNEGADFVVGPLAKEEVQELSLLPAYLLSVPVLALNYSPQARPSRQFIQFSLAPESEAAQVAEKAWQKGYRSASIIVTDNEWGKRIATTFAARWEKHHGRIVQTIYVGANADHAEAVRRLLGIDEMQKRAIENKKEKPRRRHHVDVILMAAPPEQARQLKPLFDFYYAEDVPVYATSSIYSGSPNAARDRDMNGVFFLDMPWLLDPDRTKQMMQLLGGKRGRNEYNRLFAMGADAFAISHQFQQLQSGNQLAGATGDLTIRNKQVRRTLISAQIKDGLPVSEQMAEKEAAAKTAVPTSISPVR